MSTRTSAPVRALLGIFTAATLALSSLAIGVPVASAAVSSSVNKLPGSSGATGVTRLCGPSYGYACSTGGYNGTSSQIGGNGWATWQYWSHGSGTSTQKHNCTTYAAFKLQQNGFAYPGWTGHAMDWDAKAAAAGTRVDQTAAVGAIAQWNANHVAYIEVVTSSYIEVTDDSYGANTTNRYRIAVGSNAWPDNVIHFKDLAAPAPSLSQYANTIVKQNNGSATAWFVTPDLKRLWIPDGGTWNQLKARGIAGPYYLSATTLNQLPDQGGQWVAAGSTWTGNRSLRRGMSVRSSDGRYLFAMQGDGNLVLYGPSGRAIWATSWITSAWRSQEFVIFQSDGNLVTYGGGRAIWATNTGAKGADRFVVQGDGNLVVYRGSTPLWASNTAGRT